MLRFESSNQLGNRMTTEPVELGGVELAAGTPVTLCIGAANRDPAQFADPETSRHRPQPEPASRVRHRRASMRRDGAGAARRRDRDGAISWRGFRGYALNGTPVRGGRVRFRGFLSVPCAVG